MGVKVKGGMWCDTCQRPVAGQKSTKKVASLSTMLLTAGWVPAIPSGYHCPFCGQPVHAAPATRTLTCVHCRKKLTAPGTWLVGQNFSCPHCHGQLVLTGVGSTREESQTIRPDPAAAAKPPKPKGEAWNDKVRPSTYPIPDEWKLKGNPREASPPTGTKAST